MNQTLAKSANAVQLALNKEGLQCAVLELPSSTRTASEAAASIGCDKAQIVKSLIFKTQTTARPVLVLVAGSNQVNEKQIENCVGEGVVKADASFAKSVTGFVIGGIPPLGHLKKIDCIFMDQTLMDWEWVWAAAGTPNAVFCIQSKDLLKVTGAELIALVNSSVSYGHG